MTNQNIQLVGIKAVIDNLQGYIGGVRSMEQAQVNLAKAHLTTMAVTARTSAAEAASISSVAAAERQLAITTRAATAAYVGARTRRASIDTVTARQVARARNRVQQAEVEATQASADKQLAADQKLANARIALSEAENNRRKRLDSATTARDTARVRRIERIAVAEAGLERVKASADAKSIQGSYANARAQVAEQVAHSRAALAAEGHAAANTLYARSARLASGASQQLGNVLVATTGFGNRLGVSLRFGAAAAGAFTAALAVREATQFQDALVKIDNLTDANTQQVAELRNELLDMARTIPKSPDELGATAYFVLSSGINDVNQALAITDLAAKASVVGLGSSADVARTVTAAINAYGAENLNAAQATDILVAAVQQGSAEAEDFAGGLGRLLGLAPTLGIEFDQLAAALATLTNVGIPADQAITALLGIMNQIFSPSAQAEELLLGVGSSIQELRRTISEEGLIPALQEVLELFDGNQAALEKLFPEVRGLTGALNLLRGESSAYEETLSKVRNSVGITEDAFERQSKTFSFQAGLLKGQLNVALIQLGSAILPILTRGMQILLQVINAVGPSFVAYGKAVVNNAIRPSKAILVFLDNFVTGVKNVIATIKALASGDWSAAWSAFKDVILSILRGMAIAAIGVIEVMLGTIINLVIDGLNKIQGPVNDVLGFINKITPDFIGDLGEFKGIGEFSVESVFGKSAAEILGLNEAIKDTGDAAGEGAQNLNEIPPSFNDVALAGDDASKAAEDAAKALQDLAKEFQSTSKAAREVEDLMEKLGTFGIVSFELAQALDLSAEAAGAAQGFDAVQAAMGRAERQAFNYTRALATVSEALENSAQVAREIVFDLSALALDAARSAASAVFGNPTQEVASLELSLANVNLQRLQLGAALDPQIKSLEEQLDRVTEANESQADSLEDHIDRLKERQKDQLDLLSEQIDALKEANDILIDSLKDQEKALRDRAKSYEREQRIIDDQIEALIEFLDYADITAAQRRDVERSIEGLQGNRRFLINEQNQAERMAEALENQIDAIEKSTDSQVDALERHRDALEKTTDAQIKAAEKQKEALENSTKSQEDAIKDQIESLQAQLAVYDDQTAAIQTEIDLLNAQSDIWQKQIQFADRSLLTQEEQRQRAEELISIIATESQVRRDLSEQIGRDLIPEMDLAREAFKLMTGVVNVLTDPTLATNLTGAIDGAAVQADLLRIAEEDLTGKTDALGGAASGAAGALGDLQAKAYTFDSAMTLIKDSMKSTADLLRGTMDNLLSGVRTTVTNAADLILSSTAGQIKSAFTGNAEGGIITKPELSWLGEGHRAEAVIPLTNPQRAREVIASIPPAFFVSLLGRQNIGGGGGLSMNIDTVNISDPRRSTGPVGDLAYSMNRAVMSRGILT